MTENEVVKCLRCGKTVWDKAAKYCPYCSEPLGKLRHRRNRAIFWWGVVLALMGAIPLVFVQPRIDYSLGIFAEAPFELWVSGFFTLLAGLGFIVYGYYLIRHEVKRKEGLEP
jgi:ribosomal protein L37E